MTAMPESVHSVTPGTSALPADPSGAEEVLGCGMPVAGLVDQADAGQLEPADEHQAACLQCRWVLRDAAVSRQAMELLRQTRGTVPTDLVDRVMTEVRRGRHSDALIELGSAQQPSTDLVQVAGGVRVHRQVVADLARTAAAAVRGVTVARASATGTPGEPGGVAVTLGLLVDGRTPLPKLARAVRRAVRTAVRRATGTRQVDVELTALDLLPEH